MWNTTEEGKLHKSFEFKNFVEAFAFLTKVALIAERVNHHPEIRNVYNKVDIFLYTHDEENTITEKDKHLAEKIDQVFKSAVLA
jgi:4a-hydroxytetrahydrobiopterin dehydratase